MAASDEQAQEALRVLGLSDLGNLSDQVVAHTLSRFANEADKRKIAASQQEQEQAWGRKKQLACMVSAVLGSGCTLSVWHRNGDQRVYINWGLAQLGQCFTYYRTGTDRYSPRHLACNFPHRFNGNQTEAKRLILQICEMAADWYVSMPTLNCDVAAKADVEVDPLPEEFTAFVASTQS